MPTIISKEHPLQHPLDHKSLGCYSSYNTSSKEICDGRFHRFGNTIT